MMCALPKMSEVGIAALRWQLQRIPSCGHEHRPPSTAPTFIMVRELLVSLGLPIGCSRRVISGAGLLSLVHFGTAGDVERLARDVVGAGQIDDGLADILWGLLAAQVSSVGSDVR